MRLPQLQIQDFKRACKDEKLFMDKLRGLGFEEVNAENSPSPLQIPRERGSRVAAPPPSQGAKCPDWELKYVEGLDR